MNVIIANKYKDMLMGLDIEVIKSQEGVFDVEEIISNYSNFYFDRMILDITAIRDYHNTDNLQKLSINMDVNKVILLLDDSDECSSKKFLSTLISMGIYNFTRNTEGIKYLMQNPNSYRDVAHIHEVNQVETVTNTKTETVYQTEVMKSRVIGIKSLTEDAGATTLCYIMKKQLEENYDVCAIEVDKVDFHFFDDPNMVSVTSEDLPKELMKRRETSIILVDLNNYSETDICSDMIYLVEPSTIKLNKLLMNHSNVFESNPTYTIVLNKSNLKDNEIKEFEYETKAKVYFNLPPVNERSLPNSKVNELLTKMGFVKQHSTEEGEGKNKLLGMFKY